MASGRVYVAGTCDTKGDELRYVKRLIEVAGVPAVLVDLGTKGEGGAADVPARAVAAHHPEGEGAVFTGDRGRSVAAMAVAFERFVGARDDVAGVVGVGGGGGGGAGGGPGPPTPPPPRWRGKPPNPPPPPPPLFPFFFEKKKKKKING